MNHNAEKTQCIHGHKFTKSNTYRDPQGHQRSCKECRRLQARVRNNTPKRLAYAKAWGIAHPVKLKTSQRRSGLKPLGWTPELFDERFIKQRKRCAICGIKLTRTKNRHADHEHVNPPTPRGVLCGPCNWGLGNFKDDAQILANAISYLHQY